MTHPLDDYIQNHPLRKFSLFTDNCMTFVLDFYKQHMNLDMYKDLPKDYVTTSYKKETLDLRLKRNGFKENDAAIKGSIVLVQSDDDERFEFALGLRYDHELIACRTKDGITLKPCEIIKEYAR